MEISSDSCKSCRGQPLVQDYDTGNLVCISCGIVQDFNNFQSHFSGITGPVGTIVRLGTAGSGSSYCYKETKVYEAKKLIKDLTFKLGLSEARSNEVRLMAERVTDCEYGKGEWFPVFVGACIYVVMRRDNKILTVLEVSDVIGCNSYELGRMIKRVVDFLGLKLPEFDIVGLLEQTVKTCAVFNGFSEDLIKRMLKQGLFLLQCSMKWYLTTGRRPMPVVAAVLVFVAEVNQVEVKIEDLASELRVSIRTCKMRYKEIVQRLVKVAQALPWGKDVTVKNIVKNAKFVMHYMELKSMSKDSEHSLDPVEFDLDHVLNDCFSKKAGYNFVSVQAANESKYFEVEVSGISRPEASDKDPILSHESLASVHSAYLEEYPLVKSSAKNGIVHKRKNTSVFNVNGCGDWWTGTSDLSSKKLIFEQILEKDVGLNSNPPSFDQGCLNNEKRKEKIKAAKLRIERIMLPLKPGSGYNDSHSPETCVGKKRKKGAVDIDWEDFIIETLLLHQVKEEEIEKGHYKALLDLNVFSG